MAEEKKESGALIYEENKKPQGVTLKHVSKIYLDPKTHRRFYAVKDSISKSIRGSLSLCSVLPVAVRRRPYV